VHFVRAVVRRMPTYFSIEGGTDATEKIEPRAPIAEDGS
jgi:hypothetical protein